MTTILNEKNDEFSKVVQILGETGHMTPEKGRKVFDFIVDHKLGNILELGFAYGGSTCYLGGAVMTLKNQDQNDHKTNYGVTSIDLEGSANLKPCAEELIGKLKYDRLVTLIRERTSYTWQLMKMLDQPSPPQFDFCFIDGAHSWAVDGFAFLLVDKLLKPGGWLLFDDLNWTYSTSFGLKNSKMVATMSEEERITPQIKKVYELLVKPHPNYGNFIVDGEWVFAHKLSSMETKQINPIKVETVYYQSPLSHLAKLIREKFRKF